MLTIRAMSDGKGYSSRHLEHSDYYAEGELVTGVWHGRGAELLGLEGRSEQPLALEIVLLKHKLILSWSQFVYAEGGSDELRIAFASHDVVVKGAGLDPLLAAIASHQVASIHQSVRSDRFPGPAPRFIREIVVRKIDVD